MPPDLSDSSDPRQWIRRARSRRISRRLTRVDRFSKVDAVYKSGNITRDTIPCHLIPREDVGADVAEFYSHLCSAAVYEVEDGKLTVNPPNCVDCKATDVLGLRWTPREGGAGAYKRM